MAKKEWTKWVIGILIAIATIVGSFIYDYGGHDEKVDNIAKDVEVMKPDVKQNSEHRIRFEEKVMTMEKNVGIILQILQDSKK